MTRRKPYRRGPTAAQPRTDADARFANEKLSRQDRAETLGRLAELIAGGECSLPDSLGAEERNQLLATVAHLRRKRLVHYIAHAIASDIHRSREPK
jgi:hypothetical protein